MWQIVALSLGGGANDIKSYKYTFAEKIIGAVNKFIYRKKATKL